MLMGGDSNGSKKKREEKKGFIPPRSVISLLGPFHFIGAAANGTMAQLDFLLFARAQPLGQFQRKGQKEKKGSKDNPILTIAPVYNKRE